MEKRTGIIAVLLEKTDQVPALNTLLSDFSGIIIARNGLNLPERSLHLISLVVEGSNDSIASLAGKLGRLEGVKAKSVLTPRKGDANEDPGGR